MSHYGRKFETARRILRRTFPGDRPVRVRVVAAKLLNSWYGPNSEMSADYRFGDKCAVIRIADDLGEREAIDSLIHEYAHFLDDPDGSLPQCLDRRRRDHGVRWGKWYAKCYDVVFPHEDE